MVQKVRVRYAKRGRLRFTSHRDFARAFERAIRRGNVPIAYSQGFTPHPKISYASACPTGVASEAEYLELGLQAEVDPVELCAALDASLSDGLDVLEVVVAGAPGSLADRIDASRWQIALTGVSSATLTAAVAAFEAAPEVLIQRLTKQGMREMDVRPAVVSITVGAPPAGESIMATDPPSGADHLPCAILDLVVRQVSPTVRPDDVLSGLRVVAGLEPPVPPRATRLAQGSLSEKGELVDPLEADREASIGER